ncbi:MAG: hypothetical protein GXO77_14265 [Calditrichaeota bacterium]|nr:hypothetical protein [Calditrichota bacterium]
MLEEELKFHKSVFIFPKKGVAMAILQIKDIDDNLYNALKSLAKNKRRSVSQEVIKIIESYLSQPSSNNIERTEAFLNLSWAGDE